MRHHCSARVLLFAAAALIASCSSGGSRPPVSGCTPGGACTPANVCHAGVQACQGDTLVCSDTSSNVADGTACGSGQVCSAGSCIAACVAGQTCSPAGAADPCKTYATSCNATATQASCVPAADVADRTPCGNGVVCVAGACVPASRTVSGTFQTTFWADDGSRTTVNSPPPEGQTAAGIFVPDDGPQGFAPFVPITLDANQSFSLPSIPAGPYFLQLDQQIGVQCQGCPNGDTQELAVQWNLVELRADAPDLSTLTAARADLARAATNPFPPMSVTGLAPWATGDSVRAASAQGLFYGRLSTRPTPAAGATAAAGTFISFDDGLPDASKGDVVYFFQRSAAQVGSGATAANVTAASRFTRRTDFSLPTGATPISVALTDDAPQTGTVRADLRFSQFVALATAVHPTAVPADPTFSGIAVLAVARTLQFPDMPSVLFENTGLFTLGTVNAPLADVDYGTLHYGEFLDSSWHAFRNTIYAFDASVPFAGSPSRTATAALVSRVPMTPDPGPVAPALGPPTQPQIEGRDAFQTQNGVGLQPTFTWSPPALGRATSYQVTIADQRQPVIAGETRNLSAIVYSGRKFKVPPGFLKQGDSYVATITARSGPWDTFDHAPFREGLPFHTADCMTGFFTP